MIKATKPPTPEIPRSEEAEVGCLGCILLSPNESLDEMERLCPTPNFFWDERHQALYGVLLAMHQRSDPIDVITLRQRLIDKGMLDSVGGLEYLAGLPDRVPSAANLGYYIEILTEKYSGRQAIAVCEATIKSIYQGTEPGAAVDNLEQNVLKLTSGRHGQIDWGIKEPIKAVIKEIDAACQQSGEVTGLTTGLVDLDKVTGGLQSDQMIVLAGRPGCGKSSIALNIADHLAVDLKQPVGYFSFEMGKKALLSRAIGARAGVNMRWVRQGMLSEMEGKRIMDASAKIAQAPLLIDDQPRQDIQQVRSKLRRMKQQHGIVCAVIDYLQLLHGYAHKRYRSESEELTDVSAALKELSKELHLPIIVLSALNREIERDKKPRRPRMSDLKGCGSIESDADLIGILYRADKANRLKPAEEGEHYGESAVPVNLLICKQRDGVTVDLNLTFLAEFTKFECAARLTPEQPSLPYAD